MPHTNQRPILLIPIYWRDHCIGQIDTYILAEYCFRYGVNFVRFRLTGDDPVFRETGPIRAVLEEPKPTLGWDRPIRMINTLTNEDRHLDVYDMVLACQQLVTQIEDGHGTPTVFVGDTHRYFNTFRF